MKSKLALISVVCIALSGCVAVLQKPLEQDRFFAAIKTTCGKQFSGRMVTNDPADADFAGKAMLARGVGCTANEVRIAFDVGEDKSRTWIITRTGAGLRLKHRHLLKDGSIDPLSNYGGDTASAGSTGRQEFPLDDFSKDLFTKEGRTVSLTNVWAFEIDPGKTMTYELARPRRLFRVSFDLGTQK